MTDNTLTPATATAQQLAQAQQGQARITKDIQERVAQALVEMNALIKERAEVIHGSWVACIAKQHLLMLGPGGTGKSLTARGLTEHIKDAKLFEVAFDETTDPAQVFGPPDIKAMVEDGKTRRVPTGMAPEADFVFFDEFFNGNGPLLHSIMPMLNERLFHNNGMPVRVPLRTALMGTNKLNADADQAALWDRVHMRFTVDYLSSRQNRMAMIGESIIRMSMSGRGMATGIGANVTQITLAELEQAHQEALGLDVPDPVWELFLDIHEELKASAKIEISDRRVNEGMIAVMANAWVRGHEAVETGDLDILSSMWWTVQDQQAAARGIILGATNPGEKAALDLLDSLDEFRAELQKAIKSDIDDSRKKKVGVEQVKNADKVLAEAKDHLAKAQAAGMSTQRIQEAIDRANQFKGYVGKEIFGIDPNLGS